MLLTIGPGLTINFAAFQEAFESVDVDKHSEGSAIADIYAFEPL